MLFSILALAAAAAGQAAAPQPTVQQAPAAVVAPVAPTSQAARVLPAGTMLSLTPIEQITSKHMKEGTQYQFVVVNDVVENGVVVIPRGSNAIGLVTMQTGRAVGGKSGKFDISFQSVSANGVTFPLRGTHRQEGKGNTLGALFGSWIVSGHSAVMMPGDIATAFTSQPTAY